MALWHSFTICLARVVYHIALSDWTLTKINIKCCIVIIKLMVQYVFTPASFRGQGVSQSMFIINTKQKKQCVFQRVSSFCFQSFTILLPQCLVLFLCRLKQISRDVPTWCRDVLRNWWVEGMSAMHNVLLLKVQTSPGCSASRPASSVAPSSPIPVSQQVRWRS